MGSLKINKGKSFRIKKLEYGLALLTVETGDVPPDDIYWGSISTTLNEYDVRALRDWCREFLKEKR